MQHISNCRVIVCGLSKKKNEEIERSKLSMPYTCLQVMVEILSYFFRFNKNYVCALAIRAPVTFLPHFLVTFVALKKSDKGCKRRHGPVGKECECT